MSHTDDDLYADIDLTWGGPHEYEVTHTDGTTETRTLDGRQAAQLAADDGIASVSRVTGFGANPRRFP